MQSAVDSPAFRPQVLLVLILLFLYALLLYCAECCVPVSEDASILTQFKKAVVDPLDHLSSWAQFSNCTASSPALVANSSSCAFNSSQISNQQLPWQGVICGRLHGRVTELNLSSMSLAGPIPGAAIGRLKFLRVLNLSSNNFHGSFPVDLANCTHLESLDLSENTALQGSMPREWGRLSRLQVVWVVRTALSGSIPTELVNCSKLRVLFLMDNQLLSSRIPAELGALSKLERLLLVNSRGLTGTIPATLANCSSLFQIYLSQGELSGSIPAVLGTLPKLLFLQLFDNLLTGNIPAALANCSQLLEIDLSANELSGHIPPELGSLTSLQWLNLRRAYLTGHIPATLGNCSALQRLSVGENGLSGSIPSELGLLPLVYIILESNKLTGEVPSSMFANFTNMLQVLLLQDNQLNGSLEFLKELKNSSSLFYLQLGLNLFSSPIPDIFDPLIALQKLGLNGLTAAPPQPLLRSLRSLKSLTHLSLQASNFHGSIPSDLVTSLQLTELDLSSNNLSGAIPGSLGALPGLARLDLSHNSLSGEMPTKLGSLFHLQYLNLSTNKLSGSLPPELANCAQLISINLSTNQLSGPLPLLANMPNLAMVDFSYNNFTGLVPEAQPYNNTSSTITVLLEGNPGLCGTLVHLQCTSAPSPINRSTHRSKVITLAIAIVLSIITLALLLMLATFGFVHLRKRSLPSHVGNIIQHPHGIHLISASAVELRVATCGFSADHILGTGAVSTVYRAVLSTGKVVAAKVFNNAMALTGEVAFRKEVAILAKLRHRNIVRVCGCCFNLDLKAILLELMANGSLDQHLYMCGPSCINSPLQQQHLTGLQKLRILKGVAEGLHYLHHHHPDGPIVHCDLKPQNILLDASFEACITDFGIAKVLKEAGSVESASLLFRGSIGYIPPEYGYNTDVSTKGDVYSYGVVMLEVLTCKSPTSEDLVSKGQTYLSWVRQNYFCDGLTRNVVIEGLSSTTASKLLTIAMLCTQESPFERPTMLETCHMILKLCQVEETRHSNA